MISLLLTPLFAAVYYWLPLTHLTSAIDHYHGIPSSITEPVVKFSPASFHSCNEFHAYMREWETERSWSIVPMDRDYIFSTENISNVSVSAWATNNTASSFVPYSQTNIQIQGIDEPDTIKNDGKYFYILHEDHSAVIILEIDTLTKVAQIPLLEGYRNARLFVLRDRLVVTAEQDAPYSYFGSRWYWDSSSIHSIVATYNLSNIRSPKLERMFRIEWRMNESRLLDDGRFIGVTMTRYHSWQRWDVPVSDHGEAVEFLPRMTSSVIRDHALTIEHTGSTHDCSSITYILPDETMRKTIDIDPTLVTIVEMNVFDLMVPPQTQVILTNTDGVHISHNSLYLVGSISVVPNSCPIGVVCDIRPMTSSPQTVIHRFSLDEKQISYVYSTTVTGFPLTQYSMDESANGDFRIVTQKSFWDRFGSQSTTELHILSPEGKSLGMIRGIAPGEDFQSSRFIGDRLYLVTFEQVDPLFVIDISSSTTPVILGELKIPGYSTYLHPYDQDRLIGIWYDTSVNQYDMVEHTGVKIDLYNVADVHNPKQEQTLTLGEQWSSANVLYDPRQFVYYPEKKLLLLVAELYYHLDNNTSHKTLIRNLFQGVIGVSIQPDSIDEIFRVTHQEVSDDIKEEWQNACKEYMEGERTCQKLIDGSDYCYHDHHIPSYCFAGATVETYMAENQYEYWDQIISRVLYRGDDFYTLAPGGMKQWNFDSPNTLVKEYHFEKTNNFPIFPIKIPIKWW